jgi:hypothetical protein
VKRRLFLVTAAVLGLSGAFANGVYAESSATSAPEQSTSLSGWIDAIFNSPAPDGWHERHVCAISDQADRSLCIFFPFPT